MSGNIRRRPCEYLKLPCVHSNAVMTLPIWARDVSYCFSPRLGRRQHLLRTTLCLEVLLPSLPSRMLHDAWCFSMVYQSAYIYGAVNDWAIFWAFFVGRSSISSISSPHGPHGSVAISHPIPRTRRWDLSPTTGPWRRLRQISLQRFEPPAGQEASGIKKYDCCDHQALPIYGSQHGDSSHFFVLTPRDGIHTIGNMASWIKGCQFSDCDRLWCFLYSQQDLVVGLVKKGTLIIGC